MDSYKIVGAFDTETSNIGNLLDGYAAFPCLYQFGKLLINVEDLTPETAIDRIQVTTSRSERPMYDLFDEVTAEASGYVPVILVHNLGFDMYAIAPYLLRHKTRVLAKTAKKPISFCITDENGKPALVFLDTLGLFMKSLKTLGEECGMPKAVGSWDYTLVRTPETPLTPDEIHYAKQDIYTLLCYMAHFLRKNPDIRQADIGNRVQTKTGIVRAKRMVHVGNVRGKKSKYTVRQYWHLLNKEQRPKTDDELFTMHAATRGGFTFCASENASVVFMADDTRLIRSYDSTSQHPAQMVSHLYPMHFKEARQTQLQNAFELCALKSTDSVLRSWLKPFPYAFNACFHFINLRPKPGSVFAKEGIYPLASARLVTGAPMYDNQASTEFKDSIGERGYKDSAKNAVCEYGKIVSADECTLYLTELEAWILSQCYEWDGVEAVHGYITSTFRKAPDMAVLSVMRYYAEKDALKQFMHTYIPGKRHDVKAIAKYYPDYFVNRCKTGEAQESELREHYMLSKQNLNSLFGIEATNECRRDYELQGVDGLELVGIDGIHNLPRQSKAFYQFGQRIVGWSRIAQTVIMQMIAPHVDTIICGDTDSLKICLNPDDLSAVETQLRRYAKALDKAKRAACARAKAAYPAIYDKLDGIGHYVLDDVYDGFSVSWNKSYIALKKGGKCRLTIAGVPTSRRSGGNDSFNDFCDMLIKGGMTFEQVAQLVIGYNVTIGEDITNLNARIHPPGFGVYLDRDVTDYKCHTTRVRAPSVLALFPSVKTLGDTATPENAANMRIAVRNNPNVNTRPVWLKWRNGSPIIER